MEKYIIGKQIKVESGIYKEFTGTIIDKTSDYLLMKFSILDIDITEKIPYSDFIKNTPLKSLQTKTINNRSKQFNVGSRIVINSGPLKGLEGSIITIDRKQCRVNVKIDMYNEDFLIDLAFEVIDCIDNFLSQISNLNENIEIIVNQSILQKINKISDIYTITPYQFEELIAELLEKQGCVVKLTQKSKDGGRDILSTYKTPIGEMLTIVECKQYSPERKVGIAIAERLMWTCEHKDFASQAMLVTTSGFTKGCKDLKKTYNYKLQLNDINDIVSWIRMYGNISQVNDNNLWIPKYYKEFA